MMNIKLLCVGKLKEKYWAEALGEYKKRLGAYCTFAVEEVRESQSDDVTEEGNNLLKRIGDDEFAVALEIRGTAMSSEELAAFVDKAALDGRSRLTFIIGGSNGLSGDVLARSDKKLSFSRMTFPHQMMRVILAEQLYRAFKINRGETYHK